MEDRPRTVKAMLAEAKDTSELMLDLGWAAIAYHDRELAGEVLSLEEGLSELAHAMREVCLLASRSPSDAAGLASLLQVISAIEKLGDAAIDIAKIVLKEIGIPRAVAPHLLTAEESVDRLAVSPGSELAGRRVHDAELAAHGARLLALRRGSRWLFDPPDDEVIAADDVLVLSGIDEGLEALRLLAGLGPRGPQPEAEAPALSDLDRAIDVLVDMKNYAELAVALAYAAVLSADRGLATEVERLEDRLDEMREQVEAWVVEPADEGAARSTLRGLLHIAVASETIGDAAQAMVWLVEREEELHPIIADALEEAEDVTLEVQVSRGSPADGATLGDLQLEARTGMSALAIARAGRWRYRPPPRQQLQAADRLLVIGPSESIEAVHDLVAGAAGSEVGTA
jgi:uncharacterized protein with PhoU and TrkA domain